MSADPAGNPYVGPRPFARSDAGLFFGREREARRLRSLVDAQEIAVFYAESGAGKSSIVNARLIPELEGAGCEVLAAVGFGASNGASADNLYVRTVLAAAARNEAVDGETLAELVTRLRERQAKRRLLVVDQFEELWTSPDGQREDRDDFFRQLQDAVLADPHFSVLLVMREDRIAALDNHVHLLRDRLRGRLRMERLRREDAVSAIREPAALAGRPFAAGVAEELAEQLSRERQYEESEWRPGEFVGPVELQVVCRHLWERVGAEDPSAPQITSRHLREWGDIDQALERFYERAVASTARNQGVPEEEVRRWLEGVLITPQNLRTQVPFDRAGTVVEGLATEAVRELIDDHHLLRTVDTRGSHWLELSHDRFVECVRRSNARWLAGESDLAAAVRAVERGDTSHYRLFRGRRLSDALARAEARPQLVSSAERQFLAGARRRQRRAFALRAATFAAVVVLGLTGYFWLELRRAAGLQSLFVARQEMAAAPEEGLRLAVQAAERFPAPPNFELADVLRQGLYALRSPLAWSQPSTEVVGSFAWSADGRFLASADAGGSVTVWSATGETVARYNAGELGQVRWLTMSGDGSRVAAVFGRGEARLWQPTNGESLALEDAPVLTEGAAFGPDGSLLAAVAEHGGLRLWPTKAGPVGPATLGGPFVSLVWAPDGRSLILGTADGRISLAVVEAQGVELRGSRVAHTSAVHGLALNPHGDVLASTGEDRLVWLWRVEGSTDPNAWTHAREPLEHDELVVDLVFSQDGNTLITLDVSDMLHVWNLLIQREVARFPAVPRARDIATEQPVPGGLGPSAGSLAQWHAGTLEARRLMTAIVPILTGHESAVVAVAFEATGQRLASAGKDGVRIWDLASGRQVDFLEESTARPDSFVWSVGDKKTALGARLEATVGDDQTVSLRDLASGRELFADLVQPGFRLNIEALALSPDDRLLAAADNERILVWETASGELTAVVPAVLRGVKALAFGPGDILASAGKDGLVHLDPLGLPGLIALAKERLAVGKSS